MIGLVIVIGILMNLIVFLLFYRLEKLNKQNNLCMDIVPFKSIFTNDIFLDRQTSIKNNAVVTDIPSVKTFELSKGNRRSDEAFRKKKAFRKIATVNDMFEIQYGMVPICDYKIGLADEKNMYMLYFQLGKN